MVLFVVNRLKRFLKGEMTVPAHETHPCCSNKRCHAVKNATEMLLISDDWDAKLEEFIQELKENKKTARKRLALLRPFIMESVTTWIVIVFKEQCLSY